jgi:hypothetical protein
MIQLLLVLTSAWLGPNTVTNPSVLGAGHDTFGYWYFDNDTVAPQAPVYNWIDIRTVGTPITGLADDNVVGPFPVGFNFPYYWYTVNSIYVGSNGYCAFGDNKMAGSQFANLPNPARPNNTLAPLMSDFDFSGSGNPAKAFYWTNAALDTFIVEYDSVKFWSTGGLNTFQIILTKADSCITFQFKKQSGAPFNGWVPGYATSGIENVSGAVGISYLYGNLPTRNMIHDTLAIKYIPPATTNYQVHDATPWRVMNEENGAFFVLNGNSEVLWAKTKNAGNQSEAAYPVYCVIRNATNSVVYADTVTAPAQAPGQIDSLVFDPAWAPTTNGVYTMRVITNLTGDVVHVNDTAKTEVHVVAYPAELSYDNGTVSNAMYWQGNCGGFGNRFVAPSYPIEVTAIKANLSATTPPVGCTLYLFAADGPGGMPGSELARTTVSVTNTAPNYAWYQYTLPTPVTITEGAFFVGVKSDANMDPSYSMDTVPPMSYQGWEFTGGWSPSRDAAAQDVMIHALIRGVTGVAEEIGPMTGATAMTAKPNPFGGSTQIRFGCDLATPERLDIYTTSGRLVRSMMVSGKTALWDGRNASGGRVAEGIYVARLARGDSPILKLVLTQQ